MNKDNRLGMGLGALLSTSNSKDNNSGVKKINISQIQPTQHNQEKTLRKMN